MTSTQLRAKAADFLKRAEIMDMRDARILVSASEVARKHRVNSRTVYRWANRGAPVIKTPGRVWFRARETSEWLNKNPWQLDCLTGATP